MSESDYSSLESSTPSSSVEVAYVPLSGRKRRTECEIDPNNTKTLHRCPDCNYVTSHNTHLKYHLRIHSNDRPFHCNLCDLKFTVKSTLTRHIKDVHLKEKKFQCELCEFSCSRKGDLDAHIRGAHSGIKPFLCGLCSFKSVKSSNLLRHRRNVHDIGDIQCQLCQYKVASIQNYSVVGEIDLQICRSCYKKNTGYGSRIEKHVIEYVQKSLPNLKMTSQNQRLIDTEGRYRPDVFWSLPNVSLFLEVDEHQHTRGVDYKCDERRMGAIQAARPLIPAVFIRFNTDSYKTTDGSQPLLLEHRLIRLADQIKEVVTAFEKDDSLPSYLQVKTAGLIVLYMYYTRENKVCVRSPEVSVKFLY
jgi:hypothetical protein